MRKELIPVDQQVSERTSLSALPKPCHFESDGRCRFDHDRANRSSPRKGAMVRVNDYWICNWHYENGYDRQLRAGELLPKSEQVIQKRLFG